MPSDVLQALLGLIAGGAQSYTGEKARQSSEGAKAAESAKERASREKIATQESQTRTGIAEKQILGSKEETLLKLQADKENLHDQLKANLDRSASANAIERDRLALQRDELTANIDRIDKQLAFEEKKLKTESGLKGRELNIEQAKAGLGGPIAAGGKQFGPQSMLPDLLKAYVSGRGPDMKPEEAIGFIQTVLNKDWVNHPVVPIPQGEGPPVPPGGVHAPIPAPSYNYNYTPPGPVQRSGESMFLPTSSNYPTIDIEALLNHVLPDSTLAKPIKTLKAH